MGSFTCVKSFSEHNNTVKTTNSFLGARGCSCLKRTSLGSDDTRTEGPAWARSGTLQYVVSKAEAESSGAGRVSAVTRQARTHLGFYGGPFLVADPFLEAGQEGRLGWPHIRHLVPLAHSGSGGKQAFPRGWRMYRGDGAYS